MMQAKEVRKGVWLIQEEGMPVPVRVYATEKLFRGMEEGVFKQAMNVSLLPGIQTVGVVLVLALLITPAAIASLLSRRLHLIILLSEGVAILSALVGFYISYYLNLASGASIVLVLCLIFAVAYIVNRASDRFQTHRSPDGLK